MKFYNTVLKNGEKNNTVLYINQINAILYRKEYSFRSFWVSFNFI